MNFSLKTLAAAAVMALAAGGAQANLQFPGPSIPVPASASIGNSSLLFVAIDATDAIAFSADLGLNMADMLPGSSRYSAGTTTTWNFNNNTSSDASVTGNSWSTAFATFSSGITGGDYRWGVIAADSVTGTSITGTNAIAGRGMLATGNATAIQMLAASTSAPTGNALTAISDFYPATNNLGTFIGANNGAGTSTAGTAFGAMGGNFGGHLTWNYLLGDREVSTFQYQRQTVANPVVFQLGVKAATDFTSTDSLSALPVTFSFDVSSGNLVLAAVPEASTYAMMLAGLAAIGAIVRRRRAS